MCIVNNLYFMHAADINFFSSSYRGGGGGKFEKYNDGF